MTKDTPESLLAEFGLSDYSKIGKAFPLETLQENALKASLFDELVFWVEDVVAFREENSMPHKAASELLKQAVRIKKVLDND